MSAIEENSMIHVWCAIILTLPGLIKALVMLWRFIFKRTTK